MRLKEKNPNQQTVQEKPALEKKDYSFKKSFYEVGTRYAITLNPNNRYQFYHKVDRLRRFRNFIREYFLNNDIQMVMEISEPFGNMSEGYAGPRLHTHGFIRFRDKSELLNFLLFQLPSLLQVMRVTVKMASNKTIEGWLEYCTKQRLIPNNVKYISNCGIENSKQLKEKLLPKEK